MAGKSKVPLYGAPQRFVTIEPRATIGATFGVDLKWPDGTLVTAADFNTAPAQPDSPVSRTLWSLVLEIPANITALAALTGTGIVRRTGDSTFAVGASFLNLNDVPASYAGQAGKVAVVNGAEDGLAFIASGAGVAIPAVMARISLGC